MAYMGTFGVYRQVTYRRHTSVLVFRLNHQLVKTCPSWAAQHGSEYCQTVKYTPPDKLTQLALANMPPLSEVLFLLVLAPALTAVYASANSKNVLITDWVAQNSGEAGAASYYGEVETTDICMKEISVDGCSCYGRRLTDACPAGSTPPSGACYHYTVE